MQVVVEEKVRATTASQPGPSACLHNLIYVPENLCWSGVLRAILMPSGLVPFSGRGSGGGHWTKTSGVMIKPVSPAVNTSTLANLRWAFSSLCLFPATRGPIFQ